MTWVFGSTHGKPEKFLAEKFPAIRFTNQGWTSDSWTMIFFPRSFAAKTTGNATYPPLQKTTSILKRKR